jgi:hypothetical protein
MHRELARMRSAANDDHAPFEAHSNSHADVWEGWVRTVLGVQAGQKVPESLQLRTIIFVCPQSVIKTSFKTMDSYDEDVIFRPSMPAR